MRKHRKLLLILLPVLGVIVWWGATYNSGGEGGNASLQTEAVGVGAVSQRVVAHGSIQPLQTVIVGSQVSGIVDQVLVDYNSPVRRGQVIARIEPSTFAAAVSSAQAELESAEASLELAEFRWKRTEELLEGRHVSSAEVEEARANLRQAQAEVRVRGHSLERAQRELARSRIVSPSDGIVISRRVEVGQTVAASLNAPELFEIATDLRLMQIHAYVSEADIGMVEEGQAARFVVDAHRNREFEGTVIQVRNAPIVEDNVVHYETIIAIGNEDGLLKPGMTAEVSIITAERENVLRVRNPALRARLPDSIRPDDPEPDGESNGRVYLVRDGRLIATPVTTGLSDGVHTEILAGLSQGDTLAVGLSLRADDTGGRRSLISGSQAQY